LPPYFDPLIAENLNTNLFKAFMVCIVTAVFHRSSTVFQKLLGTVGPFPVVFATDYIEGNRNVLLCFLSISLELMTFTEKNIWNIIFLLLDMLSSKNVLSK
jgi:hypothetical protein